MSDYTHLIVCCPRNAEAKMLAAGFRPGGRMNGHTITLFRTYTELGFAMTDAKTFPKDWVWATEPAAQPQH